MAYARSLGGWAERLKEIEGLPSLSTVRVDVGVDFRQDGGRVLMIR